MEENKLIAEFIGFHEIMLDEHSKYDTDDVSNILEIDSLPKLDTINPEKLNFHASWDWLMPVVARCQEIDSKSIRQEIGHRNMYGANISIVYEAVVEFIKQYNKQDFDEGHQSSVMFGVDNNQ